MQNNIVRVFVITLAFAGFSASAVSAKTTSAVKANPTSNVVPTPLCPPGSGSYCGLQ